MILNRHDKVREIIIRDLQGSFSFDISSRILILADVEHYSKDDPWVNDQAHGKKPDYYEIYWDTCWICDFTTAQNPRIVYINFWHGMLNAYMNGKIQLNEWLSEFETVAGGKLDDNLIKMGLMEKGKTGNYEKSKEFLELEQTQKDLEAEAAKDHDQKIEKVITKLKTSSSEDERTVGEVIEKVETDRKVKESLKKGTSVVH